MIGRLAGAVCAALLLPAPVAKAGGDLCDAFQGSSVGELCTDLVSSQTATGPLSADTFADTLYDPANPDDTIPPPPAALCASGRGDGISGADLSALLKALTGTYAGQKLSLSGFTILGEVTAPARVPYSLEISNSVFCGPIDLRASEFDGYLHLKKNLVLAGPDDPREGVIFADGISVSDSFELQGSRFGALIVRRALVGQALGITEAGFGHLTLARTRVNVLALARSKQSNEIAGRAKTWFEEQAGQEAFYNGYPKAFFVSNAEMWDAVIADLLYGDEFFTEGALSAYRLEADSIRFYLADLRAADFRELKANTVELKGVHLGQDTNRANCSFDTARRFQTDFVSFSGSTIERYFEILPREEKGEFRRTQANGHLCLNNMRVADSLDISGLDADVLDLSESRVGLITRLENDVHDRTAFTSKNSRADFTRFQSGYLTIGAESRLPARTSFSGASIGFLEVLGEDSTSHDVVSCVLAFLSNVETVEAKVLALRVFADTFATNGLSTNAAALEFERLSAQTDAIPLGFAWAGRNLAELLGGYGLKPGRTLIAAGILATLGAALAIQSVEGRWFLFRQILANPRFRHRQDRETQMVALRFWLWGDALVLSFDRLIPLVTIADAHKKLRFAQQPWVRTYFSLHALLGLLLAATVVTVIGQTIGLRAL